jgi:hypothetical protein
MRRDCAHEPEVAALASAGRWPQRAAPEMIAHVENCAACGDVAALALLFGADRDAALARVSVPPAGQVWWRVALRARMEDAQTATRPVSWAQGVTGACVAGAACAIGAFTWPSLKSTAAYAGSLIAGIEPRWLDTVAPLASLAGASLPLVLGAAACTILAPLLVLWFALAAERGEK